MSTAGKPARRAPRAGRPDSLSAPFPYFGGKSRIAELVWSRLGDVRIYAEPFAGGAAVLLGRPEPSGTESINDVNHYIVNFWRASRRDPEAVARYAEWPTTEADLHARHRYLLKGHPSSTFREAIEADPEYFDPRLAGYWVWGQSCWIGGGWCGVAGLRNDGEPYRRRPTCIANGVRAQWRRASLAAVFEDLSQRLESVVVCCGHWSRICDSKSTMVCPGYTGVFLDPPYALDVARMQQWMFALEKLGPEPTSPVRATNRADGIYAGEAGADIDRLVAEVHLWCRKWGTEPRARIAVCGYEGEHDALEGLGWSTVAWSSQGGYGARSGVENPNRHRERIWFSPACLSEGAQAA